MFRKGSLTHELIWGGSKIPRIFGPTTNLMKLADEPFDVDEALLHVFKGYGAQCAQQYAPMNYVHESSLDIKALADFLRLI